LILSEFAGAADELKDAIQVNPYNTDAVVDAIKTAINMPLAEQIERMSRLRENVTTKDIHYWTETFLSQLAPTER